VSAGDPSQQRGSIAVVGGGVIGLSLAWRLAQCGWRVTVFDQTKPGGEASWAAAGMLAPGGEYDEPSALADIGLASRRLYSAFVEEIISASGESIDFQENGALELAYSAGELAALDSKAAAQQVLGIRSKRVDTARVRAFWPRVRHEDLSGARFYPDDAVVNPREITSALAKLCRALGVRIEEGIRVSAITIRQTAAEIRAGNAPLSFSAAIVAAGAWSSQIELDGAPALPEAKPIKGHLLGYHQPEQTCNTIVRHGHIYALQRANGLLVVGASVEDVGWDRTVRHDVVDELSRLAAKIFPHLGETTPSEVWTGFRPGGTLQISSWHSPRLWLAYGHYRNGILQAPWTAQKLSREINATLEMR
jgi:glycine oxidase